MKAIDIYQPDIGVGPSVDEYEAKYARAKLMGFSGVRESAVQSIIQNRTTYEKVEKETGVPWWWLGCIHTRESNRNFQTWLANGDPLHSPTRNVPAGLRGPGSPPWDWHTCAIISLKHDGLDKETFDSIGKCLRLAEQWNGWGYITGLGRATTPPSTSPFVWSGTNQYEKGKYFADSKFDPNLVDAQLGVAAMMMELERQGVELFRRKGAKPVGPKATWFKIWEVEGSTQSKAYALGSEGEVVDSISTNETEELSKFFSKHRPGAKTFRLAKTKEPFPPEPTPPSPDPVPVPGKKVDPVIRLSRHPSGVRSDGLVQLTMEFFDGTGKKYGEVLCVSGVSSAQRFRTGRNSVAGSLEPLPEGVYSVGNIEFVSGRDNYSGSWGAGLGPVWIGVTPLFSTSRSALGMHRDDGGIGTAGCIGISSTSDLRELVRLLRQHDPQKCVVDYGLGSLPPEFKFAPQLESFEDGVGVWAEFSPTGHATYRAINWKE